ncbi:MAG: ABC transporter permease subunit [Gammaproteobacteria bacterium]|nr:ABC transporter permease subunit [Gammaproteobacteria bacterium]
MTNALTGSSKRHKIRHLKDKAARIGMGLGGISVIIAITLIFFYLLYVVIPMFKSAEVAAIASYELPGKAQIQTLHLSLEEQNQVASRITTDGEVIFFNAANGNIVNQFKLATPHQAQLTAFALDSLASHIFALGFGNGKVVIAKSVYDVRYNEHGREIIPRVDYPYGDNSISLIEDSGIAQLAIKINDEQTTLAFLSTDDRLFLAHQQEEESFLDESDHSSPVAFVTQEIADLENVKQLIIDDEQRLLYALHNNSEISLFDISDKDEIEAGERISLTDAGVEVTSIRLLTGGISLLIADDSGEISQWFPVKKDGDITLEKIRHFKNTGQGIELMPEQRRKGFLSVNQQGELTIYHATAHRELVSQKISDNALLHLAVSPRADHIIAQSSDNKISFVKIQNEHPEISWSVLWDKIWYESYDEPSYTWQSSSASNDFEPKYSLMPLAFGTLKAAFYAMLFAIPLAILGAIYTAYFMAPKMRAYVKPTIEIMEALPTVILGFLAGLWLAPLMEEHLAAMFTLILLLPLSAFVAAGLWQLVPASIRLRVPDGWQAALLIPYLIFFTWFGFAISGFVEAWFFAGNMKLWVSTELGLDFDQRNAMVVGIAMGVAVIPTIFSIAEDAIFSVPKHLTFGSLALGATPWQTLVRVVILTASPGIFSAIMIGFGRAVGETMIVLMATGNTPVMDLSIFQGMRTLSANIAVEMPESEVNSTHYRILFLAALVLFFFTFMFNTLAEIVRQRLRNKYSSL